MTNTIPMHQQKDIAVLRFSTLFPNVEIVMLDEIINEIVSKYTINFCDGTWFKEQTENSDSTPFTEIVFAKHFKSGDILAMYDFSFPGQKEKATADSKGVPQRLSSN